MSRKKREALKEQIRLACGGEDIAKEIYITRQAGDIERFTEEVLSRGSDVRIYACGGDGTLNILANCAYGHDNAEIGVIPYGTGNDFIKNFTNYNYFSDIEAQIKGTAIKTDCISFDDQIAVNMINIGFDSAVVEKSEKIKKVPFAKGPAAYIIGVAAVLIKRPLAEMEITFDNDENLNGKFLLCAIANGSYCGGGFNALSKAVIDDGYIDIAAVYPLSRTKFISIVGRYKKGTLLD